MLTAILALALAGAADEWNLPEPWEIHRLSETPAVLEPEVTFLERTPEIDGVLDSDLKRLPKRPFHFLVSNPVDGPARAAHYRLAYGASFLYVYVEYEAEELVYRDRAYQNGDGFHMVLARPMPGGEPTEEFYVIACSAVNRPDMEWTRRIIWYYNVTYIFQLLSPQTRLEFDEGDGRIGFELLLQWQDVPPHHPWHSDGIGFNLCFVKGEGEQGEHDYQVLEDPFMQSELRPRKYRPLVFQRPPPTASPHSFVQLDRNTIRQGEALQAEAVSVGPEGTSEHLWIQVSSGEGNRLRLHRKEIPLDGLTRKAVDLETAQLPPGGYGVQWFNPAGTSRGETGFTILPRQGLDSLKRRLEAAKANLAPGSLTTLLFRLQELQGELEAHYPYETAGTQRIAWSHLAGLVSRVEVGEDVIAAERGQLRRAFRSELDGTLQPYMIRLPDDYDPAKRYPLIVFLHGSASDETDLPSAGFLSRGNSFEMCPRARGTSHSYLTPESQVDIAEAVADVRASYPIDTDKIVLAGFSMGGYGVYRTFWEHPTAYRALAVISGDPDLGNRWSDEKGHPDFTDPEYLKPFTGVPIFVFHGKADRNCPYKLAERAVHELRSAGAEVTFVTEEEKGHAAPSPESIATYLRWLDEVLR